MIGTPVHLFPTAGIADDIAPADPNGGLLKVTACEMAPSRTALVKEDQTACWIYWGRYDSVADARHAFAHFDGQPAPGTPGVLHLHLGDAFTGIDIGNDAIALVLKGNGLLKVTCSAAASAGETDTVNAAAFSALMEKGTAGL